MAGPGIARQGGGERRFKKIIYTHHRWGRQPLEGSWGLFPQKILKTGFKWCVLEHISVQILSLFCFWDPEQGGGGGRPLDPPL